MSSTQEKAGKYSWTLMVYLAGDNNLSDDMIWALKEVYRVGPPEGVAITLQFDPLVGKNMRFFRLLSPSQPMNIDGVFPILQNKNVPDVHNAATVDDLDAAVLAKFVVDSMEAAPADHYMLILSGHGGGILGDFLTDNAAPRPLTMPKLGKMFPALREGLGATTNEALKAERTSADANKPLIDVLGLDSCLMSMAEICFEIDGQVRYLVASEGFDPNAGWPYFRLLEQLKRDLDQKKSSDADQNDPDQKKSIEPQELARNLVQTYAMYYSDYIEADVSVDISSTSVDRERVQLIEIAVKNFVDCYLTVEKDPIVRNAVVLAHWKAQSYRRELYTDLVDFCFQLQNECALLLGRSADESLAKSLAKLQATCAPIIDAVRAAVDSTNVAGPEFQYSYGLSVYFPWSRQLFQKDIYDKSKFAARTDWGKFLTTYVDGTRRCKRARFAPVDEGQTGELRIGEPDKTSNLGKLQSVRFPTDRPDGSFLYAGEGVAEGTGSGNSRAAGDGHRAQSPVNPAGYSANRSDYPANRSDYPANRFADIMAGVLDQLPPAMKNPATDAEPLVAFSDRARVKLDEFVNQADRRRNKADRRSSGAAGQSRPSHTVGRNDPSHKGTQRAQ
jgi:hypothetical protein